MMTFDKTTWNQLIARFPGAHFLQTWEWGQIKQSFGWSVFPRVWLDETGALRGAALVLQRKLKIGGFNTGANLLYVPRGPMLFWEDTFWRGKILADLKDLAHRMGAIFIKIDPEVIDGKGVPGTSTFTEEPLGREVVRDLIEHGWVFSREQIQFANTIWLDLSQPEEVLLSRMKQKTRYNLRLAQKKGVIIREGDRNDLALLYHMYAETSVRDGFVIRPESYYRMVWQTFLDGGKATILIAEVGGETVAGLVMFHFKQKAWFFYGMSRNVHREKMPGYLLQWEAIRVAKRLGCEVYDMWGAPTAFSPNDPLWNVYRFKEGFGGEVIRTIGAWDLAIRPRLYRFYTRTLPHVLNLMRQQGKNRLKQQIESL